MVSVFVVFVGFEALGLRLFWGDFIEVFRDQNYPYDLVVRVVQKSGTDYSANRQQSPF